MTRTLAIVLGAATLAVVGLQDTATAGDYWHEGHYAPHRVHQQQWHGGHGGWYSNHARQYSHGARQSYSRHYESRVFVPSLRRGYHGDHGGFGSGYIYGRGAWRHGHSRGHIDVGPLHFGW